MDDHFHYVKKFLVTDPKTDKDRLPVKATAEERMDYNEIYRLRGDELSKILEEDNERFTDIIHDLRAELDEARVELAQARVELTEAKTEIRGMAQEIQALETEIEELNQHEPPV